MTSHTRVDAPAALPDPGKAKPSSKIFDKSLSGLYDSVGGAETLRLISRRFHRRVEADPVLRELFPKNMHALEERLGLFLAELTGGPSEYSRARGKTSLLCRHAHLAIGTQEQEGWLAHMAASLADEGISEADQSRLLAALTKLAAGLADPCMPFYSLSVEELRVALGSEPLLAGGGDGRARLLRAAALEPDLPRMRLLLECGAEVDAKDAGGHNALYRIANSQNRGEAGPAAISLLVEYGATVNQVTGVGGMTPLHMSARRGTVAIAEALLDRGADIDPRDKRGETPLRRAVNCGQERMVRFLVGRGANSGSKDKNGRSPLDAARSESVRRAMLDDLLESRAGQKPDTSRSAPAEAHA